MTGAATIDARPIHLVTLLTWFSPAFPTGAFAYSHGLEAAIAQGWVRDARAVQAWAEALLASGSGWSDLVLLSEALRAPGDEHLCELDELAVALAGSAERRAETVALGTAFAQAVDPWARVPGARPYPLAVARAARALQMPAGDVLAAYAHGFAAGLVSAAVRLVPLGQSEAVAILRRLELAVGDVGGRALCATLDDLGSATLLSDVAAMRHETLNVRLFRS